MGGLVHPGFVIAALVPVLVAAVLMASVLVAAVIQTLQPSVVNKEKNKRTRLTGECNRCFEGASVYISVLQK
jgi:hypothetical protein